MTSRAGLQKLQQRSVDDTQLHKQTKVDDAGGKTDGTQAPNVGSAALHTTSFEAGQGELQKVMGGKTQTPAPAPKGGSKGKTAALAGADKLKAGSKKPGFFQRTKKATAAALVGLTLLSATNVAAQEVNVPPPQAPTAVEQVVQADGGNSLSPLNARLMMFENDATRVDTSGTDAQAHFNMGDLNLAELGSGELHPALDQSWGSPGVQAQVDEAYINFAARVGHLSEGGSHIHPNGDRSFTDAEKDLMLDALKDLLKDMPVAAFSEGMANNMAEFFDARGVNIDRLDGGTLKDYGRVGGDYAKQLAENWRDDSPVSFYSTATALAGGLAAGAYFEGSDLLRDVGIRPEISTRLFDKSMKLKFKAEWGAEFSDFRGTLEANQRFQLSDTTNLNVFGNVTFSDEIESGRLGATLNYNNGDDLRGHLSGVYNHLPNSVDGDNFTLSGRLQSDNWRVDGNARYDFGSDRFRSSLSAGYETDNGAYLYLQGNYDTHTDSSSVMAGIQFTF